MEFPADIGALVAEGRRLQRARRYDEALEYFNRALAMDPGHLEALGNRGGTFGALGRFDDALKDYDRALQLAPGHAMLLYNRGNALHRLDRLQEALESFDQALAVDPAAAETWNNRGNTLRGLKRAEDALASYTNALALRPDYAKALYNRGNVAWVEMRQIEPAWRDFERAFAIDPDSDNLRGDLLHLRMHVGDWRDYDRQKDLVDAAVRAGKRAVGPFAYQAISQAPADLQACSIIYAADRHPPRAPLITQAWPAHEKIRVGYLCGEFREQATSFLTAGLYEEHDKSKFRIIAFDNGWSDQSPLRRRLEKAFSKFVDISRLSDENAAKLIAAEEIDILVNLNGYFGENRMSIFARRPAPVQVNYLGFPATLGASYMDYILADRIVIPENERQFYTEQVITLPDSYQANDSKRAVSDAPPSRAAIGLPQDAFVFCSFNQTYKLTPAVFASWMRILDQVPRSVLWLLEGNSQFPGNIRREAQAAGVSPERIIFASTIPTPAHVARLSLADLFLDTTPYNAHTTASDALWAGLPLITVAGTTFPGRVAASLLAAIGLPELVTADMPSYESLAVTLATDPGLFRSIRKKLRDNRDVTPLFDTVRFTRAIEAAYIRMWETSCKGLPAQAFSVEN
ncbi:MAG TPA: tetratricopeptide repeat protein [Rhizomicrobium sp.]|nr:tetratricopeptide repeat protein [Rhizomicrobium sp.]